MNVTAELTPHWLRRLRLALCVLLVTAEWLRRKFATEPVAVER